MKKVGKAMSKETLRGLSVAVTRFSKEGEAFYEKLLKLGAEAHHVPLFRLMPRALSEVTHGQKLLDRFWMGTYDWVTISSVYGVRAFAALLRAHRLGESVHAGDWLNKTLSPELTWPSQTSLIVVGPSTAREGTRALIKPHAVAEEHTAEGMVRALLTRLNGGEKVLIVRGNLGRDVLDQELSQRGFHVDVLVTYDNVLDEAGISNLAQLIAQRALDVVTLTSPSTAEAFHRALLMARERLGQDLSPPPAVSIGPITTKRAQALGLRVIKEAHPYTEEGLIKALESVYTDLKK